MLPSVCRGSRSLGSRVALTRWLKCRRLEYPTPQSVTSTFPSHLPHHLPVSPLRGWGPTPSSLRPVAHTAAEGLHPRQRPQPSHCSPRCLPTSALQTVCPVSASAAAPCSSGLRDVALLTGALPCPRRFLLQLVGILLEDIVTKQPRVEMSEQQHTFYCQELGTLLMCLIHIFKSGGCCSGQGCWEAFCRG